jgi:hypothetical protein
MNNKTYINGAGRKVLEYVTPDSIVLDMPYILSRGKRLSINKPYMKLEKKVAGNDIAAIRLLDFDDADGIVSLIVQELPNGRTYTISANMDYDGDMWLWTNTSDVFSSFLSTQHGFRIQRSISLSQPDFHIRQNISSSLLDLDIL